MSSRDLHDFNFGREEAFLLATCTDLFMYLNWSKKQGLDALEKVHLYITAEMKEDEDANDKLVD